MALKDELGERGYPLWDAWSATSTKYAGAGETRKKWDSFRGSGVHIETLFWNALEMGYKPKPLPRELRISSSRLAARWIAAPSLLTRKKTSDPAPEHYIPGLVGMITRHILASSVYPLPPWRWEQPSHSPGPSWRTRSRPTRGYTPISTPRRGRFRWW